MIRTFVLAWLSGGLFAMGLMISGMADPNIVLAFLNITDSWRSDLMWVMIGALCVVTPVFYWSKKYSSVEMQKKFNWPTATKIDRRLVIGAAIFGIGWGLVGICPAPAIVQLAGFSLESIAFIFMMFLGFRIAR